ncbi:MAG: CpsD/CapB family tyrosine-protein kinase [Phycisphaerae bacterium]|nr:CpsD/CapB family tyrosine-protein kinase [Phycisphaerae bacterium]
MDSSIRAPSDISRRIDLPLLGMVPHIDDVDEEIGDLRTAFLHHPDTIICEAFRQIRTTLMFHGPDAPKRSILIASAMPEDGRTTVALNLASHISSGGGKILVLDANFRQPAIHGLFPECPPGGLSSVLLGEGNWKDYIHPVSPRMYVMPSGPAPQHPTELLGSRKMSELLEELYEEFDQVIIDSAPCLVISDTVSLSTLVDGVVLVVLAGENTHGVVQRTRDMLSRLGVHIYGAVLNGVRVTAGGYLRKNYDTFYEYRDSKQARATAPAAAVEPGDDVEILDGDVDNQNI